MFILTFLKNMTNKNNTVYFLNIIPMVITYNSTTFHRDLKVITTVSIL